MTPKEYLSRARWTELHIQSRVEQAASLRMLASKTTSTVSNMPKGGGDIHAMESVIVKLADLERSINCEVDELAGMKRDISDTIASVDKPKLRLLLELRYLNYKRWDEIAAIMKYDVRQIFRMHGAALNAVQISQYVSKCH